MKKLIVVLLFGVITASAFSQQEASAPRPAPANMVRINGGTFIMGSPANEPERKDNAVISFFYEGPQHQITVSGFYMGKYEVTQKEYQEAMGTNPSEFKGDNLPVERVSWYNAIEYCREKTTPVDSFALSLNI